MSGPAWTQRPSRWPPSRDNSAEAVQQTIPRPALSGGSSSTAIPPAQEAPYLTHLTRHQGAFTLTAPPNMGRRRHSGEEETQQPVAGPSTSPPKRIKKKKGKKSHLDPEITNAVINAGRRTPSPSHAVTQDTRYRPALSSNASERPSLLDRNSGDEGMSAGRISLVDERDYEARVAENRGPEYARGDAWDYGLDVPLDSAPPFAPPPGPPPSLAVVPPPPHLAPQDPLSFPSYPPPEYPFTPLDSFRPDLPIAAPTGDSPSADDDDEEDSAESDFVFSENDPLVLAWEADRAAGLSLDERITRDLERRVLAAAPNSPPSPVVSIEEIESPQEEAQREAEQDQEQERMRYQRREIELAEGQRDEPRIARALSIYAGRRFAEAAERRLNRRRSTMSNGDSAAAGRRRSARPSMPTPISTAIPTPMPTPSAPVTPPVIAPATTAIDEEESESDGENSAPAQVARNASRRQVAEATERRIARAKMMAVVESPGGNSEEEVYHGAVEEQDEIIEAKSSTFQQLFPPRPLFGRPPIVADTSASAPVVPTTPLPPIDIVPSTSAFAPPPEQPSHVAPIHPASLSIVPPRPQPPSSLAPSPLRPSPSYPPSSSSLQRQRSHPSGPRTMPPVPPSRPPPPPPPVLSPSPIAPTSPDPAAAELASVRAMMNRLERSSNRRPAPPPPRPRLPPPSASSSSSRSLEGLPIAQRFATTGVEGRFDPPPIHQRPPLPVPPGGNGGRPGVIPTTDVSTNSSASMQEIRSTAVATTVPEVPSSTRPQPPVEANAIAVAPIPPPPSDFYTDLDVLLSRLETQEASNYEELIMLGEVLGSAQPVIVGSTMEEIGTLGVARVELERKRIDKQGRTKTKLSVVGLRCSDCSICMVRFRTDDFAVVLPICLHIFHADCIGRWLSTSRNCPLCRGLVFEPKIVDV